MVQYALIVAGGKGLRMGTELPILKKYFKFFADMRSVILFISAEMIRWIP